MGCSHLSRVECNSSRGFKNYGATTWTKVDNTPTNQQSCFSWNIPTRVLIIHRLGLLMDLQLLPGRWDMAAMFPLDFGFILSCG